LVQRAAARGLMTWNDILEKTALEQAALIRERKISSEELTRLYLSRIERLNPMLQAFVSVHGKGALKVAKEKDAAVKRGGELPAFDGARSAMKDLNFVRGMMTRFGSRSVAVPAPLDDKSTTSLKRAGFIVLGKTATSEMGALPVTEPDIPPPTRN